MRFQKRPQRLLILMESELTAALVAQRAARHIGKGKRSRGCEDRLKNLRRFAIATAPEQFSAMSNQTAQLLSTSGRQDDVGHGLHSSRRRASSRPAC